MCVLIFLILFWKLTPNKSFKTKPRGAVPRNVFIQCNRLKSYAAICEHLHHMWLHPNKHLVDITVLCESHRGRSSIKEIGRNTASFWAAKCCQTVYDEPGRKKVNTCGGEKFDRDHLSKSKLRHFRRYFESIVMAKKIQPRGNNTRLCVDVCKIAVSSSENK